MKNVRGYLRDILIELADIVSFTTDGKMVFMSDSRTKKAVIRSYEVIGMIVKRLPESLRKDNPQVNWRRLTGFRDLLAHNYEEVILEFVWDAVEDLPNLRASIETLLANTSADDEETD